MLRTASIRLSVTCAQAAALHALRTAYADGCNSLVPIVREHRCWNRVGLHNHAYSRLRAETPLGSQMACNAIYSVCKAYKAQKALGRVNKDTIPLIRFDRASVMGVDVGENNLAATSLGKVFGGECLRERRDRYLARRRRLQSNGSQSARHALRQASGKERRRVEHVNHETSKAIVAQALSAGVSKIRLEDLTHIRDRIRAGRRMRARLHRWAFRQLQQFIAYKAQGVGIAVEYVNPAYTSQTCSDCRGLGRRLRHRFVCEQCGLRAHADLNASRNLAWIDETAVSARAAVDTPDVEEVGKHVYVSP